MKQYRFKTNIKCEGCIEKVTPYLQANNEIRSWHVDLQDPYKILTVETDELSPQMVKDIVQHAGYSAEPLEQGKTRK